MPPVLDPTQSKVDGLAFLGLSLARKSDLGHPASQTHQTAFDLNEVIDRDYEHLFSSNDDGWLVGGGEPPHSYKLAAPDSAHVEIMRIGTYEPQWGGVSQAEIVHVLQSGQILIPNMVVVPTAVVANGDRPPELEIRFDMVDDATTTTSTTTTGLALPVNWQLRFVHNQLFKYFQFPSRFCPGAFHSTILRKAEFRSQDHETAYFAKCDAAVAKWRQAGPQPLLALDRSGIEAVHCTNPTDSNTNPMDARSCAPLGQLLDLMGDLLTPTPTDDRTSGIYLFRDRNTITHYFFPNFLPDTPEKVELVRQVLAEHWDEASLSWHGVVSGGAPSVGDVPPDTASSSLSVMKEEETSSVADDDTAGGKMQKVKSHVATLAKAGEKGKHSGLPKNKSISNLLYNKLVAAGGGSNSSITTKARPLPAKERRHRGRPRSQRPVAFPSGEVKTTTTTSKGTTGLFKLHHRTRHGIVEEIPAAAAE